ncbi:DUF4912 domain-containing protein [Treponema zuelzerae]|uniref:DUF4912 domain-containing protein n=1 Tax=Teretinema zuelzerae TaxID=156 RepID=A0AAE3EGB9_9SPIR|nr:DUF4912 domain-containing protein [Teretinema zuelzerae]MBN2812343.1 DUF4912 domain-containing protein [Spirochaetales bacterium]MCD1653298.1 DUF4912 domain-containing protein [Teretinema zuelzerae]
MEQTPLSRAYLESLSTSDLVSLAEEYGIDVPEGLNRRFIIGEVLEIAAEDNKIAAETASLVDTDIPASPEVLPETYNETAITVLMRDPGWVFVFWDFHSNLYSALTGNHKFESFFLRVNSQGTQKDSASADYYDIDVGIRDRKWYAHLPVGTQWCRVDLYTRNSQEKEQLLAKSQELCVPCSGFAEAPHEEKRKVPPLLELSGFTELRKSHFRNHRQSFM